jgi:hypothetical protein
MLGLLWLALSGCEQAEVFTTQTRSGKILELKVQTESGWGPLRQRDLSISTETKTYGYIQLSLQRPYHLLSERPIKNKTGYAWMWADRFGPDALWLELDTTKVRPTLSVNFQGRYILNWDPHLARVEPIPTPIRLSWHTSEAEDAPVQSIVSSLPEGDTTSRSLLLLAL